MTEFIKTGLLTLMSEKCYDNYFVDFNFFDGKKNNMKITIEILTFKLYL
jgi:hypothetical protein